MTETILSRWKLVDLEELKGKDWADELEFQLTDCLKPSGFVRMSIGSRSYSQPDRVRYSDCQCEANRNLAQRFEFAEDANPLLDGIRYRIEPELKAVSH